MKATSILLASGALAGSLSAATLTSGHTDFFSIDYVDEDNPGTFEFEPHLHVEDGVVDGSPVVDGEFAPDEITISVSQSTFDFITTTGGRPSGAEWDPIGVPSGSSYWFLPSGPSGPGGASALGTIYGGLGAEELNPADWSTPISVALVSVSGPGQFSMWDDSILGPVFYMASSDGIDGSDVATVNAGDHTDNNFAFSAPGSYDITIQFSGTHVIDGLQTATSTYQFQVVPEPSTALFGIISVGLLLRRRR